jgi:hypothetical protein
MMTMSSQRLLFWSIWAYLLELLIIVFVSPVSRPEKDRKKTGKRPD